MQRRSLPHSTQGVSRPSRCNFARGVSHTPPDQDVPIASPNEPATMEDHEQLEEEQNQPTEDDDLTQAPSFERSNVCAVDMCHSQQQKLLVGIQGKCVRNFYFQVNIENMTTKRALEAGTYRGGSRKVTKWMEYMEKRDGTMPRISTAICE